MSDINEDNAKELQNLSHAQTTLDTVNLEKIDENDEFGDFSSAPTASHSRNVQILNQKKCPDLG